MPGQVPEARCNFITELSPMHLRLLLVFSSLAPVLYAQADYQLFRPGVQYLYDNPDYSTERPDAIANEVYGVRVGNGECEELYTSLQPGSDPSECVREVPSPFGTAICQYGDSTVMRLYPGDSLVLRHGAPFGTRWIARDSAGTRVYAAVTDVRLGTVYGMEDSLKTISFYVADSAQSYPVKAVISRKYGLVSAPRFYRIPRETEPLRLAGASEPMVGQQLPPVAAYDSVAVGDVFHLRELFIDADCGPSGCTVYYYLHQQRTAEIRTVEQRGDTTYFTYRGDLLTYRTPLDGDGPNQDSTLVRDSIFTSFVTGLPEALADRQPGEVYASDPDGRYRYIVMAQRRNCGHLSLRLSTDVTFEDGDDCGFDNSAVDGGPQLAYTDYVPFFLDSLSGLTGPYVRQLVYENTAAGECGDPFDFSDITIAVAPFDPDFDRGLKVFPNPAGANGLLVELPVYQPDVMVELYDFTGRRVQRQRPVAPAITLDTRGLSAGTYLLLVSDGSRTLARRRVILH